MNNRGVTEARAGRSEEGAATLRQALALDPHDAVTRKNLSGVLTDWARQLLAQGQVDRALGMLQESVSDDPDNGFAFVLQGDLYYLQRNDLEAALEAWTRAHGHVPAPVWQAVANRIAQVQRDRLIERGFASKQTAHCDLRFQGTVHPDLTALEQLLEQAYGRLAEELRGDAGRITVMIYTEQDLRRVYGQRDWAIGFYDGRIRLRLDDLNQPYLSDVLAHELAHAFLHRLYGSRIPHWVHEGYAQLQEQRRAQDAEAVRIEHSVADRTSWIPLKWLDRHFDQPSSIEDVARAYAESRLVISELVKRYGIGRFREFLAALAHGTAIDAAYDRTFAPSRWSRADQGHFE